MPINFKAIAQREKIRLRMIALNEEIRETAAQMAELTVVALRPGSADETVVDLAMVWRRRGEQLEEAASLVTEAPGLRHVLWLTHNATPEQLRADGLALHVAAESLLGPLGA